MYYNADEDYYVCPRGQHLEHIGDIKYDHGFIGLVALAHNLRKYARVQTLELPITSEPVVAELPKTHEKVAA